MFEEFPDSLSTFDFSHLVAEGVGYTPNPSAQREATHAPIHPALIFVNLAAALLNRLL